MKQKDVWFPDCMIEPVGLAHLEIISRNLEKDPWMVKEAARDFDRNEKIDFNYAKKRKEVDYETIRSRVFCGKTRSGNIMGQRDLQRVP